MWANDCMIVRKHERVAFPKEGGVYWMFNSRMSSRWVEFGEYNKDGQTAEVTILPGRGRERIRLCNTSFFATEVHF